ncbi:MAG: flavodoxin [Clostridia bacterium]|nr:flavodoxin [Clostridia bacterium]
MDKKIIALLIAVLVVVLSVGGYFIINSISSNKEESNKEENTSSSSKIEENNNIQNQNTVKKEDTLDKKVAVVYFSATGTTRNVAEFIKDEMKADIFEIIPKEKYTDEDLTYNNSNSRATKEQNDKNARPEIGNNIDVSNYNVIFLGYPIWWGDTPRIIQTFMESHELKGKTVIPFCTSGSSSITESENTLKKYEGINWISGKRLTNSKDDVLSWVKTLNI